MQLKRLIVWTLLVCFFSTPHVKAQNLKSGLIAHYLFNKEVKDHSGNNNHGKMFGGLKFDKDRFGNTCGALNFNGADSYVEVASSQSLESPTNQLSITVWFKLDAGATDWKWLTVCCKSNNILEADDSPQYRMQATRATLSINTEFTENLNAVINFDTWHHYSMVYDGGSVKGYLDGSEFFNFPYSNSFSPNRMPLEIGRDMPGAIEHFAGSLDDLRIYNRGLSAKEVIAIYNDDSERTSAKPCNAPPPPPPPPAPPAQKKPPVVTITNPSSSPFQADSSSYLLRANIENIFSAHDIIFMVNGQNSMDFSFDRRSREFRSNVPLSAGKTLCEITATNKDGKASGSTILQYTPVARLPEIVILAPATSPYQAPRNIQQIMATITNIGGSRDIVYKLNGTPIANFSFDPRSQTFTSDATLVNGNNIFEISASNKDGKDSKSGIIRYQAMVLPPIITINQPILNPHEVSQPGQQIQATIENINGRENIQFRFNGKLSSTFSYNPATRIFTTAQVLEAGYNAFEISAENADGRDNKTGSIIYRSPNIIPAPDPGQVTVKEEVEVKTSTVKLVCYDHKREDGDIVSVIINGEVVIDQQELKALGKGEITLNLPPFERNKEYILISKAWNLGKVPPNTMSLKIYDGTGLIKTIVLESEIGKSEAIRLIYRGK